MGSPVIFVSSGWLSEVPFHAALARALRQQGVEAHVVVMGSKYRRAYAATSAFAGVHDLCDWMRDHWDAADSTPSAERLSVVEREYGTPSLWQYLAADRHLCDRPLEYNLRVVLTHAGFWANLFVRLEPRLLVGEISHFHNYFAWAVARRKGVAYAHLIPSRIPGHAAIGGPFEHRDRVAAAYQRLLREGTPRELADRARDYIAAYRARVGRAAHLPPVKRWFEGPVGIGSFEGFVGGLRAWRTHERSFNYTLRSPVAKAARWMAVRVRKLAMVAGPYFHALPTPEPPFVLFGLHLQPESSTLVRGQFFQDMLAVVRNVALSLPARYVLYVKEHDVMFGYRPLWFFRELRRIPNVVCVSPYESGPELVRRAAMVVAVTGTFGWDAALLGKPALVLGEPFFATYKGIDHVTDMTRLPDLFRRRLNGDFRCDEDDLVRFTAAVFDTIVPASMDDLWGFRNAGHASDADVLADALLEFADTETQPRRREG